MTAWPDLEDDLRRVLEHPGFVELSSWPAFVQPWAVGVRFDGLRITWFRAESLSAALTQAVCAMERLGSAIPRHAEEIDMPYRRSCGAFILWVRR